ncbi:FHA domain-containing protein [Streptomyces sp. NBRC 110028]|uniref:FHA domain-containing protein n=1 Tax=Streptomyces sp. NBRC 110028 TaxID=1621260 RepID=UPI0006E18DD4|nr:FHA domain-containing protein [Streptomyces sp. NBRC 110028]
MQIRLTVLGPRSAHPGRSGHPAPAPPPHALAGAVDVLVTAPVGTALASVTSGLAAAVAAAGHDAGGGTGAVVVYAGSERLDPQRCALGEPPLVDGAVLSLHTPADPDHYPGYPGYPGLPEAAVSDATVHLDVIAGPDAGGVHLLHGGQVRIGRSAEADVPLDDPDVSRLHCAVTVTEDGRVTIADLGSTNGTAADGAPVGRDPVPLAPGALLRIGESALRLRAPAAAPSSPVRLPVHPDGEGHLRVAPRTDGVAHAQGPWTGAPAPRHPGRGWAPAGQWDATTHAGPQGVTPHPGAPTTHGTGTSPGAPPADTGRPAERPAAPGHPAAQAPWAEGPARGGAPYGAAAATGPRGAAGRPGAGGDAPHGGPAGSGGPGQPGAAGNAPYGARSAAPAHDAQEPWDPRTGGGRHPASPGPRPGGPAGGGAPYDDQAHPGPRGATGRRPADDRGTTGQPGAGEAASYGTPGGPHGAQEPWPDDSRTGQGRHPASPGPRAGGGAPYDDQAATGPRGAVGGPPADARGLPGQRGSGGGSGGPREPWPGGADRQGAAGGSGRGGQEPWAPGPTAGGAPHGAADRRPGGRGRGTPLRGTTVPQGLGEAGAYAYDAPGAQVRRRGIGAWVRQLTGGRGADERGADEAVSAEDAAARAAEEAAALHRRWPDPAAVLMTALGPGPRLWERGPGHPDALTVRLGSADRLSGAGGLLPAAPVTVDLRQAGSLGLAGPRGRLAGLARSVVAQLAALHPPGTLEIVLLSTEDRPAEWSWLGWLPQLQPLRGQDCRLLLAYDAEQVTARAAELTRRLNDAAGSPAGPYTVVIVDGDPGPPALRETLGRLAVGGPGAGIHLLCLAEAPAASPASPLSMSYETACAASAAFTSCEVAALLSGDVATGLQIVRRDAATGGAGVPMWVAGATTAATVDAVSGAWAERFARALAPLRPAASGHGDEGGPGRQVSAPLPDSARLLDELGLARATPASLMARWAAAADEVPAGGRALAVLGAGPRGPVTVDLAADGPHLLIDGGAGTGKTELLRSLAASLAAAERPDRLELVLLDGAGASDGAERGEGLRMCTDLPHVSTYLAASDPVRMREFAQALSSELKRRAELLGRLDFVAWHGRLREGTGVSAAGGASPRVIAPRSPGDVDAPPSTTLRLRPQRGRHDQPDQPDRSGRPDRPGPGGQHDPEARTAEAPRPFPRLVVLVDDFDALVAPALGSPGRPAAGSVVRALEAIARDGAHLGVHLVAASGRPDRTADTAAVERAGLRIVLEPRPLGPASSERPEAETHTSDASGEPGGEHAPGRGRLLRPEDAATTPFQAGRVTGRIPRTATQRPTVVTLEWERMGDPPARRPLRELGNGPTDLALLASALQRAAQSADAPTAPALI